MFWLAHDGFIADNRFVQLAAALTTVLLLIFSFWTVFVQVTHVMPVDGLVVWAPELVDCAGVQC